MFSPLPAASIPVVDPQTGLMNKDWYDWCRAHHGEINTWTPRITFATPGSFNPGTVNSRGQYCRIGPLCFYSLFYSVLNQIIGEGVSGALRITGLPYEVAGGDFFNTMAQSMIFDHNGIIAPGIDEFALVPISGQHYFEIYCTGPGFSLNVVSASNATNVFGLIANGWYWMA